MSRLIIQNLPPSTTPSTLQQHFSQPKGPGGDITDFKVVASRRFGFIGYKTEAEAEKARSWFDGSYFGGGRVKVGIVEGTATTPRPNKRRKLDPSSAQSAAANSKSKLKPQTSHEDVGEKVDKQRDTYLELVKKGKSGPSWANEGTAVAPEPTTEEVVQIEEEDENNEAAISDADWLKMRMAGSQNISDVPSGNPPKPVEVVTSEGDVDATRQTILSTSRLFIRNLAFSCTDEELSKLMEPFGEVSKIHIPLDTSASPPKAKGMAYITFVSPSSAVAAYDALDGRVFQGRLLHILGAVDRRGKVESATDEEKRRATVKGERAKDKKKMAGKEFNWGVLYMNSDAVASSIADRFSISKSDILNPDTTSGGSDNAAVKLALAETHVINETKTYLEQEGILLSAFDDLADKRIPRSTTTILAKNIPYGTTPQNIRDLFEPHGELRRVLVPPAGTMAVVEFVTSEDAAKGFAGVAYRRIGSGVVYLEWAPGAVWGGSGGSSASLTVPKATASEEDDPAEQPDLSAGSTLYIKNLSFSTTTERLTSLFAKLPSFSFARVQTKPDPNSKNPSARLSMGYGFVGFKTVDAAKSALKGMKDAVVDGRTLDVRFAGRGAEAPGEKVEVKSKDSAKGRTTKMIAKNVPFEVSKKDIRELFSAHGSLKSVRLPKKFDSRSRGFAFLDFVTRHEAENAYNALKHTHLLGRHLVLEWAEEEEQDIEKLRLKAGVGFGAGKSDMGKKRKLNLDVGGGEEEDLLD